MGIVSSEIKMFKSLSVSDTAGSNGGRMSQNEVVDNVNNNIFPDVSQAQRLAGATTLRKVFVSNTNGANLPLLNARVFVENYTPGDDAVVFVQGTQNGVQSALTGSEEIYGCGKLDANVLAGAAALDVLIENPALQFFASGDVIRISDKASIGASGNEEFFTVASTPSVVGSVVSLSVTPNIGNAYSAVDTRVAKVCTLGDLVTSVDTITATTAGNGEFTNPAGAYLYGSNQGTVDDHWTLTFTSATAFTCAGTMMGALAAGSTLSTYAPLNPDTGAPFFTIAPSGFTGVWATGDTLTFDTHPASAAIWAKRVVPPAAAAVSGNKVVFGIDGETS